MPEPPTQPDGPDTVPECEEPAIQQPTAAEIPEQHAHNYQAATGNLVTISQLAAWLNSRQQWLDTLKCFFCEHARISRFDSKQHDSFIGHDILVATVYSAARHPVGCIDTDGLTLLVADEVHHLGAPSLSNALSERFVARLSLTATFSRNDSGLERFLKPYFKAVCYRYTLAEASAEGVVAPYELQYLAIPISEEDLCTYRNLNHRMSEARRKILAN